MKMRRHIAIGVVLAVSLPGILLMAGQESIQDFTGVDPPKLGVELVAPQTDPTTGFVVGGKNPTSKIRDLKELNGRTIAALEKVMRPGAASQKGFLGAEESLLDVLAADNRFVVDDRGITHQQLAKHLRILAAAGDLSKGRAFLYHGRRFKLELVYFRGYQDSPFRDGTKTNAEATVHNLDSGKTMRFSLLVPDMIERYGFYEGKGTPYRLDPRTILEVLDFLHSDRRP